MVWGPRASTLLVLLAPSVFWENRAFCINSEDFPESWISAQKRDTRTVLLKTALVRVSCIQNTQIRGKTIAKVFGKVDTFWTYQLPPSLAYCLSSSNSVDKLNAIKRLWRTRMLHMMYTYLSLWLYLLNHDRRHVWDKSLIDMQSWKDSNILKVNNMV